MVGARRTRRIVSLAGLWYLLASTYLLARLFSHRIFVGVWGVDSELVVEALVIPLAQVGVVHLLGLGRRARPVQDGSIESRTGMGEA